MALGVARALGVRLMENFEAPYLARGPRDFWRRWHISLSTWLRDYLYIPLGGNRRGVPRTQMNLMTTMLLGGLWHGASWTFVIWGGAHGLWLALERGWWKLRGEAARDSIGPVRTAIGVALTFAMVCLTWLIFRAQSIDVAAGFLVALGDTFDPMAWTDPAFVVDVAYVLHFFWPVAVVQVVRRAVPRTDGDGQPHNLDRQLGWLLAAYAVVSLLTQPHARHDAPFVYFQF